MKKLIALLLAVVMVLGMFAGCGSSNEPAAEETPVAPPVKEVAEDGAKELVVGLQYDFGDISPFGIVSSGRGYVTWIYGRLATPQHTAGDTWEEMYWDLAKNITKIDDYTYQVEIHDCVYDSEGNHITAEDVAWCFESQLAKANDETITNYMASCTAIGDYAVEFKLSGLGLNTFEYLLKQVCIVSKAAFEASGNEMATMPVSTGPYKITSFVSGSEIVFEKNENYWRNEIGAEGAYAAQNWDKITFKCIQESAQMTIALQDGTIDTAIFVNNADLGNFLDADNNALPGYNYYSLINSAFTCLLYNCDAQSPMSDMALRQAVSYAIDADSLVKAAIDGKGGVLKAFSNPRYADYQEIYDEQDYFGTNLDTAKEWLDKSNYNGEKLVIAYETNEAKQKMAQVINACLSQIGIESEIVAYDTALFNTYKYDPAQWDILIDQKGSANGFVTFPYQLCFAPGAFELGTANFIQNDEKLVELYNLACSPETHSDETVQAFENHLRENAYVYALYYTYNYAVANDSVVGELFFRVGSDFAPNACVPAA